MARPETVSAILTENLIDRARDMLDERGSTESVRSMLTAVLSMPEVRQAIYEEVRRESDEKLKAMGVTGYSVGWDR